MSKTPGLYKVRLTFESKMIEKYLAYVFELTLRSTTTSSIFPFETEIILV